jgi:hypothetical protein
VTRFVETVARQPALAREQTLQRLTGYPITALLPEQQRLVEVYREEYFRVGSSTDPADHPRAERAITALYAEHGYDPPRFEWGASPQWGAKQRAPLVDSLRAVLRTVLRDSLGTSLFDALGDSLRVLLENSIEDSLYEPWHSLRSALRVRCRDARKNADRTAMGVQESYWVAFHLYGHEVLGVPYQERSVRRLYLYDEVVRSCGWWWPYPEVCICTDRPALLEWTEESPPKLRRVRYRDGWEVTP